MKECGNRGMSHGRDCPAYEKTCGFTCGRRNHFAHKCRASSRGRRNRVSTIHEVRFMGHLLTSEGLKADPSKVEAILEMPPPNDVKGLKRFLGMVNYLVKFLPLLSDMTEPLRRLQDKETEWCWLEQHRLVVPTSTRKEMLKQIHRSHMINVAKACIPTQYRHPLVNADG